MMKYILAIAVAICAITETYSQRTPADFSYVVVPDRFDFLDEDDKFQLNSITKFLFNKHGFNAYFPNEVPNLQRCDGLYAEVIGKPAIIRTKVTILLMDCKGNMVFSTETGTSKLKQLDKSYNQALRRAFVSIEELGVQQPDPEAGPILVNDSSTETIDTEEKEEEPVNTEVPEEMNTSTRPIKETRYTQDGKSFALAMNQDAEYVLFELDGDQRNVKGRIKKLGDGSMRLNDTSGNSFVCAFDDQNNLIVDTGFQTLTFTKVDQ